MTAGATPKELRESMVPGAAPGRAALEVGLLALVFLAAAKVPLPSDRTFETFFFWPAAAVSHTAFYILGRRAALGIALGSLILNLTSWLSWPYALAMTLVQTLEPWVAWRLMVGLGCPQPDLRQVRDLLRWSATAALTCALFSSAVGSTLVNHAHHPGFRDPLATAFSWFLGDLVAILCLGPLVLLGVQALRMPAEGPAPDRAPSRLEPWLLLGAAILLALTGHPALGLPPDLRLALPFGLVLPLLWAAVRLGPVRTALGLFLLAVVFVFLHRGSPLGLPSEAFRFAQLLLLVLAAGALVTAASAHDARMARQALALRELQAQRMEAVATLAGGLVHGFNNQLTVLMGNLDRLRLEAPEASAVQSIASRLEEASRTMEGTVRQLRALSNQAPLQSFSLPLSLALEPFLADTRNLPERLTFESTLDGDPSVNLDPALLRQALGHLLANSREALDDHGRVRLRGWAAEGGVHICLEDDGPGMSPDVLRRACDPYFTTRPGGQGRGMGLAIAFSLARQMGGSLRLDSAPGRGTRAELVLPPGLAHEVSDPPPAPTHRVHRVLLADDEAGILELTREVLEEAGFEVVAAADGQEAWEAFQAAPEVWDLALLDLVMPRLHGAELAFRIQALRPDLPILFMSGYSEATRPGLLAAPHRHFLAKPFRIQGLLDAIRDVCPQAPHGG